MAQKWIDRGYPVCRILRVVSVSRSTYYWRQAHPDRQSNHRGGRPVPGYSWTNDGRRVSDQGIQALLLSAVEGEGYAYGYRKLTHWLRREHQLVINPKKGYRLCKEMGILKPNRPVRRHRPRRIARNRQVTGPNQLWETDIKYGYIVGEERFFFIQTVLDVWDRMVVDYHVGLSCTGVEAAGTLVGGYASRDKEFEGTQPMIRSDNGPQFTSHAFATTCERLGINQEFIPVRTPNKQAHIEAFHSILEEECLSRYEFGSFSEAYLTVVDFMDRYNFRRIHGSLGYRTPKEFHDASLRKTENAKPIKL